MSDDCYGVAEDDLPRNIEPFRCAVCGRRHRWHLCQECRATWQNPDGTLPAWLCHLRAFASKEKKRWLRRRAELLAGGAPLLTISLDQLVEQAGETVIDVLLLRREDGGGKVPRRTVAG